MRRSGCGIRGYPKRNSLFSGCHGHGFAWSCFCRSEDTATPSRDRGTQKPHFARVAASQVSGRPLSCRVGPAALRRAGPPSLPAISSWWAGARSELVPPYFKRGALNSRLGGIRWPPGGSGGCRSGNWGSPSGRRGCRGIRRSFQSGSRACRDGSRSVPEVSRSCRGICDGVLEVRHSSPGIGGSSLGMSHSFPGMRADSQARKGAGRGRVGSVSVVASTTIGF